MRYLRAISGLILAALVAGCAAPGPSPAPSVAGAGSEPISSAPAPAAPVQPATASPAGGEKPSATPICASIEDKPGFDQLFRERERLVMDALQAGLKGVRPEDVPDAVTRIASCLHTEPVVPNLFVVSMRMEYARELRVAVWQRDDAWRAASLSPAIGDSLYFRAVREKPGGLEALTIMRNAGSGHAGAYHLLQFASEMTTLWKSKTYDHFNDLALADDWLLGTYRDPAVYHEPHVTTSNCCLPTDSQVLWRWEGDTLVEQGNRNFPDPYRTVSAFIAAWDQGKPDLLAPWVIDAATLKAMMADAGYPSSITMGPQLQAVDWLITLDAIYWDKLPPTARGPRSQVADLVWPATPKPLRLKRVGEGWKVAGWGLLAGPGPSEADAMLPVSRLDPSGDGQGPYADLISKKAADAKARLGEPSRTIRTIEGTEILVYERLGLAMETWAGEVVRLVQTAGQVAPEIRIGGAPSGVEQLPNLRVYETGRETIFASNASGTKYEVHVASGRIVRAYVSQGAADD